MFRTGDIVKRRHNVPSTENWRSIQKALAQENPTLVVEKITLGGFHAKNCNWQTQNFFLVERPLVNLSQWIEK